MDHTHAPVLAGRVLSDLHIEPGALFAAERWLRNAMWSRYRPRLLRLLRLR
jgi:hypothetical protein